MTRTFHKMHGLGNDFVIFDAREEPLSMDEALARAVSDRKTGIGCDQLIVLETSSVADLKMRIWNHDGIEVESCGNASRCVVALTHAKTIETGGGLVTGEEDGSDVEVSLGEPRFEWDQVPVTYAMPTNPMPMAWGELHNPVALSVGNPHVVFFVENAESIDLDELGPRIEHDPVFPDRINVNVAEVHPEGIRLRTWERGAGITRACGTGASATAVAAILTKRVQSPVKVTMRGGSLTIAWAPGEPIRMRGSATYVFKGEIDLEPLA
ncbi:diaminopimelate epimerase [Sphingomonas daechungensis]|uniref:diaminopimelate epimerase n=1 Tax=Sphingomonas daechungensis TaxID=1176646 RepID=UPI0037841169